MQGTLSSTLSFPSLPPPSSPLPPSSPSLPLPLQPCPSTSLPVPTLPPSSLPTDLAAATHKDDEYVWAGVEDPKIVVTTSHNPSSRLKQFAKVVNTIRLNLRRLEARRSVDYWSHCLISTCSTTKNTDHYGAIHEQLVGTHMCTHK